jgi:hypothetical protein
MNKFLNIIAYPEFKQSWKEIKQEKAKYLFLFFQIVIFSDMLKIGRTEWLLFLNLGISFLLCAKQSKIQTGKIFLVIIIYLFICIYPIASWGLITNSYIGYALRILAACLIANYFRNDFVRLFENLVFFLAYISIPLFLIQVINPHIYDIFTPLSRAIMAGRQYYAGEQGITMHQYFFVYVMNGWALNRNSGFMWEPAAYGAMLTWALLFNLYIHKFSPNKKMFVFLIAIFTTFSLGTYSYILIIGAIYLLQNFKFKRVFPFIIMLLVGYILLTQTDAFSEQYTMITEKTEYYSDTESALEKVEKGAGKTNRVAGVYANLYKLKESPFGFGMYEGNYIASANGLVNFLMKWGVFGALILIISYKLFANYLKQRYFPRTNIIVTWLTVVIFIMPMIGNPIYNQVFFLAFLLMPYFFKKVNPNFIKQQRLYVSN